MYHCGVRLIIGEVVMGQGGTNGDYRNSVLPAQFCCVSKTCSKDFFIGKKNALSKTVAVQVENGSSGPRFLGC